jgi:hypothetical protein
MALCSVINRDNYTLIGITSMEIEFLTVGTVKVRLCLAGCNDIYFGRYIGTLQSSLDPPLSVYMKRFILPP